MIKLPFRFFRIRGAIALLITFIVLRILFNDFFSSLEYTAVRFLGLTNHAIHNVDQALGPIEDNTVTTDTEATEKSDTKKEQPEEISKRDNNEQKDTEDTDISDKK